MMMFIDAQLVVRLDGVASSLAVQLHGLNFKKSRVYAFMHPKAPSLASYKAREGVE